MTRSLEQVGLENSFSGDRNREVRKEKTVWERR